MTPAAVHYGRADELNAARRQVLLEGSSGSPRALRARNTSTSGFASSGLDQPAARENDATGGPRSPLSRGTPYLSYPRIQAIRTAIASEPNRDRTALTPRPSLIEAH